MRASGGMLAVFNHFSITSRRHCNSILLGNIICRTRPKESRYGGRYGDTEKVATVRIYSFVGVLGTGTLTTCGGSWCNRLFFVISPVLKLVHEGEIASYYVSLIALNADPTFSRVAISERPSVDMSPAQFAVLVTPARRNQPSPRADRQSLVGRRIVSTLTPRYIPPSPSGRDAGRSLQTSETFRESSVCEFPFSSSPGSAVGTHQDYMTTELWWELVGPYLGSVGETSR